MKKIGKWRSIPELKNAQIRPCAGFTGDLEWSCFLHQAELFMAKQPHTHSRHGVACLPDGSIHMGYRRFRSRPR